MTNRQTILTVDADLLPDRLVAIARQLGRDLEDAGVQTLSVAQPPKAGERSDPVAIGQIALALVTTGAVNALIQCFQAYIARERTLVIKLTRPDGTAIEVSARNVDDPAIKRALTALASV